ncbi:MAG: NADH:ubiquinone oxidoreductase subunit NDUFA12 [Rhodospirillaceae bacterium]|nr:NADH:ubiquinone oxidoreductase subunit NDUFA12 [Rhodospirillaceae bacterium]
MRFDIYEWGLRTFLRYKTWRRGERVGQDASGNVYYQDRKAAPGQRQRRWVVFNGGESEASRVPAEWHGWLHHQTNQVPSDDSPWRRPWQKEHSPNLTGTIAAYRPPGAIERGGHRAKATGDYEPWVPS